MLSRLIESQRVEEEFEDKEFDVKFKGGAKFELIKASRRLIKLNRNARYSLREVSMIRGKISGKFPGEIFQKFLVCSPRW